jgi:hypothetical protein
VLYALTLRPLLRLIVLRPLVFLGRRLKRERAAQKSFGNFPIRK